MQPVPGHYQAQLTDHVQTFKLRASSSAGQFLKVIMHGKVQQQLEDRQYFTAIRCVKAIGRCLPAAAVHEASQLIRSGQLPLSQVFNMPVSVCLQLLNTTVHCRYSCAAYYSALTGCNCPPLFPVLLLVYLSIGADHTVLQACYVREDIH